MKVFRGWLAAAIVSIALPAALAAAPPADGEAEIGRWISAHARHGNSDEVTALRSSVTGDLDGDARNDVAVLFTLRQRGGRQREMRYLAVFRQQAAGLRYHAHVLVGSSGAAEANRATILNRMVVVEMLTHSAGDAACCPTHPETRRYRLTPHGLQRVKEPAKPRAGTPPSRRPPH